MEEERVQNEFQQNYKVEVQEELCRGAGRNTQ